MPKAMEFTVTQKLRLFLARSGQAVAPWSSVDEVMDHLYALLYDRREQDGVWYDLAALLDSLQSETRGVLAAPDAEILSRARVDSLVAELRRAMRASVEAPAVGAMRRFSVGKGAGVAACVALLVATFSLGCGSSNSHVEAQPDTAVAKADTAPATKQDTAVPADTAPATRQDTAVLDSVPSPTPDAAAPDSTPPPPQDAAAKDAGDASVSPGDAADAIGDSSPDSTGDALMDLFRDGTPADIATKLEAAVEAGTPDRPIDRPVGVIYKGVTFPTDQTV